jgi:two-component system response regulator CpxR
MKKVLLVHDDQSNPRARVQALELAGFEVTSQQDARRALALIQKDKPDLVVSDVLVHGMTGFELCLAVRGLCPPGKLPLILCSGIYRAAVYRDEARRIGAQDYLVHPTSPSEFVERVRQVLGQNTDKHQAA